MIYTHEHINKFDYVLICDPFKYISIFLCCLKHNKTDIHFLDAQRNIHCKKGCEQNFSFVHRVSPKVEIHYGYEGKFRKKSFLFVINVNYDS